MAPKLKNNKAIAILDKAAKEGYAVPGVCVYNLEATISTLRAAASLSSPALLLFFPPTLSALPELIQTAHALARASPIPIAVHLDHAQTPETVRRAADTGCFDSVMVDMSHYARDENLRLTRELTAYCHERGIAVEAEPGRIEGGEDGVADTAELEGLLTTPEEARAFAETGIDWLAPAFGNVHGKYGSRGIQLDYERLAHINAVVGKEVRLVLHGTDGFDAEIYGKCVKGGIAKANVNRCVNERWMSEIRREGVGLSEGQGRGMDAMKEEIEAVMRMLGSVGKA